MELANLKQKKKVLCLVLLLVLGSLQTGCWSMKELNTIAFVLATGIDRTPEGKILLTVQIARPGAFGGGGQGSPGFPENNVWVVSEVGATVLDARRELETKVPRRIYWGHNVVLLIGEDMARHNIKVPIDFFTRSPVIRETFHILVTKGKAYEVLNSHSQLESTSAQSIGHLINRGMGYQMTLKDLSVMLASKNTKNPVLPVVALTPSGVPQGPGMKENLPQVKGTPQNIHPLHGEPTITGSAIFSNDYKLVDWLDMKETRGVLLLKNQIRQGVVTFSSPSEPTNQISVRITDANTTVEPYYDGEQLLYDIKCQVEGDVFEKHSNEDLTQPRVIEVLNQAMSEEIKANIEATLKKAQENEIDIFEFGDKFHLKYPQTWLQIEERWDQVLANASFQVTVESEIRRSGLVAK